MKLVILCGGSGTRLWPISRTSSPKQFAKLFDNKSLFQLTIERNQDICDGLIVVVNAAQLELCQSQIPSNLKEKTDFIIEPCGRNTAPAITLAALCAPNDELLVVPSDHLIQDLDIYKDCIGKAAELAKSNKLVTFGLTPTHPETGFGYIESSGVEVLSFKEKPDLNTAKSYIEAGNFFWNSGMFYFSSKFYLEEIKSYHKEIYDTSVLAFEKANIEGKVVHILEDFMLNIPKDSIDYAVMEKSKSVNVVEAKFYWTDLGSYDSLYDVLPKTEDGNTKDENLTAVNSKNNLILSNKRVIATFDIEDLIIVDTADAILIGKRGESQEVKKVYEQVKQKNPELLK
jgi:mannose-1-phosphate guanylyltransferase